MAPTKKRRKGGGISTPRLLVMGGIMLGLGSALGLFLTHNCSDHPGPVPPKKAQKAPKRPAPTAKKTALPAAPLKHVPEKLRAKEENAPPAPSPIKPLSPIAAEPSTSPLPKMAVVMDDLGYIPPERVQRICARPEPLTLAVLPFLEHSRESAEIAHANGKEVMLHMPMAPLGKGDPGPGAVLPSMEEEETRLKVRKALLEVPWRKGVNNHMGSKITPDPLRMRWIMEEVKAAHCFFVDSRTEKDSVAEQVAVSLQVPVVRRNVFLDDDKSFSAMKKQWERAVALAKREGHALVICHVYPETIEALEKLLPATQGEVRFVPASALVKIRGLAPSK